MPPPTPPRAAPGFLGSRRAGDVVEFRVYAPEHRRLDVVLFKKDGRQQLGSFPMTRGEGGYHHATFDGPLRLFYKFLVDGQGPWPDPASRSQPFGVHGPSEVVDERYAWSDAGWRGVPIEQLVLYEAHVGAATAAGTFDGLAARLPELRDLGVTAVELMPVASFPGRRNWGYDGVSLFAPHAGYGGATGLCRFVDAAHRHGLAVLLDVVYNHLGPDGNYLRQYAASYFTPRHTTPWGDAVNYADPAVRAFVLHNVEMWIRDFHLDGLRLDATHAIVHPGNVASAQPGSTDADPDGGEPHVLRLIGERARAAAPGRHVLVIAEDDRNERRLVTPPAKGGYQLDAVWADDFHHALRRALAGDSDGYYADYAGTADELATILRDGWLYQGQRSTYRHAPRGTRAAGIDAARFVHCIQNHDQVGNRAFGDRLGQSISPAAYRAATALLLLAPATPLLFMGQEWNASTPFLYFTDHHADLGRAVRDGRRAEFAAFTAFDAARRELPDPQSTDTFERSILRWDERAEPAHAAVLRLHQDLLRLRRAHSAFQGRHRDPVDVSSLGPSALGLRRRGGATDVLVLVNLAGELRHAPEGRWRLLLSTEHPRYGGAQPDDETWNKGAVRLDGPGAVVLEAVRA